MAQMLVFFGHKRVLEGTDVGILWSFIFFYLGLMPRQDYFTHFEPSQLLGGAKMGDTREKTPDHPQAELVSRKTRARLKPTVVRRPAI